MNPANRGELLFERYLRSQNIPFTREPPLAETCRLLDYSVDHPLAGKILFEVKEINVALPLRPGAFDPYHPIDSHLDAAKRKFKGLSDYLCVIVLFAGEASFVDIQSPHLILGSMYGRWGWTIPIPVGDKVVSNADITPGFVGNDGRMINKRGPRSTRVAAVLSLMDYDVWAKEAHNYILTDDGRTREERQADCYSGVAVFDGASVPCVTVWENAVARRRLPQDLFRGEMDAWWTADSDGGQRLSFIGARRLRFGIS